MPSPQTSIHVESQLVFDAFQPSGDGLPRQPDLQIAGCCIALVDLLERALQVLTAPS
jgi:hypothetical protein